MYHISIHFSETSPFQTSIHQNIEFIIYRFKYNLQSTNNTRPVNSKASNIYLPNHTFPSILRFSILRYCRTTSLSSIQRWLMPRMSGSSNRGSSFAIVTRGIVTLHRERRPVRRTKGDREREGRGEGGRGIVTPVAICIYGRYRCFSSIDYLRYGRVVGCTAPKHRGDIDFRCWPTLQEIPFRTRNCHYLRWLGGFFVLSSSFPFLLRGPLYRYDLLWRLPDTVNGNYRLIIRSESHALIKWLWRRWKLGPKNVSAMFARWN